MDIQSFVPDIEARFLRYVKIDSQSDESSPSIPSTTIQYDLLNLLADELRELELSEVEIADYGCVFATIPATVDSASRATRPPAVAALRSW